MNKRKIGLDYLRIALAILIFAFHSHAKSHLGCYYYFLDDFVGMGAIAMTAFFILSGYSLYMVYGKSNLLHLSNIKRFYIKRFINIIPLYYLIAIIHLIFYNEESIVQNIFLIPIEFLGLQSQLGLFAFSHNGGTWFISCLLLCYFLYPFLEFLSKSMTNYKKVVVIFILFFIDIIIPFVGKLFDVDTYSNSLARTIEFTIGILLAQINYSESSSRILHLLRSRVMIFLSTFVLVVGVTLCCKIGLPRSYQAYNIIAIPCFIPIILSLGFYEFKQSKIVIYLSKISYPFFLAQIIIWPLCEYTISAIGYDSNLFRILCSFTMCTLFAIFMYEVFDKPIGNLLTKQFLK